MDTNKNTFVFLSSEDVARVTAKNSDSYPGQVEALQLDEPASVSRAAKTVHAAAAWRW